MKKTLASAILIIAIIFSFAGCTEKKVEGIVNIYGIEDSFVIADNNMDKFLNNYYAKEEILINKCGMSKSEADSFYETPEEWLLFSYSIIIQNDTEESITAYDIQVDDNGKNKVFLNCSLGGEVTVGAGSSFTTFIDIFCSDAELSLEEVKAIADEMSIGLVYTKTPEEKADGSVSVEETKVAVATIAGTREENK